MKYLLTIATICCFIFCSSCKNEKREHELEDRIAQLEKQLDECQNGELRLFERLKSNYDEGNYAEVLMIYKDLSFKFPGSPSQKDAKELFDKSNIEINKDREESAAKEKAEVEEKRKSLTKLKKSFDDVSGINWYYQKYFTHYTNSNRTSVYMGSSKGSDPWLILKMSYEGEDWIFFENAYLSYDGNTREFVFDRYKDKETENGGGSVWEWINVSLTDADIEWMKAFASSPNAKMRLSGKYTKTRNLSAQERQGILDILAGYEFLRTERK